MRRDAKVRNAADPAQVAEATRQDTDAERARETVLRELCATTAGRRYLWALLQDFALDTSPARPDPYQTYHNIGWQDAGRHLRAELERIVPDAVILMHREARDG